MPPRTCDVVNIDIARIDRAKLLTGLLPSSADLLDRKNRSSRAGCDAVAVGEGDFHEMRVAPKSRTSAVEPLATLSVTLVLSLWIGILDVVGG